MLAMTAAKDYKTYASQVLAMIYEHNDHERIYDLLRVRDPKIAAAGPETFGMEYLAGRLALACRVWENACIENGQTSEDTQKALLRRIMQTFDSDKFLKLAQLFSEYLHAPEIETQPTVAVTETLFKRLGAATTANKSTGPEASPAFETLVGVSESFRTSLENQFFEFVYKE